MGLIKENGGTSYTSPLTPPTSGGEEDSEHEQEGTESSRKIGGEYIKIFGEHNQDFGEQNLGFKLRKMSESSVDSGCGMPSSEVNIIDYYCIQAQFLPYIHSSKLMSFTKTNFSLSS